MSASEPVMNAVEKVARVLFTFDDPVTPWDEAAPIGQRTYRDDAARLIAAFPQLALEGREEWGVAGPWSGGPDITDSKREAVEFARVEHITAVRRMAFYEPWSEVPS